MKRPGEDNLTEHIRQELENYAPAYNPASWDKLNSRLQTSKPVFHHKPSIIWLVSGILITLLLLYIFNIQQVTEDTNAKIKSINNGLCELKNHNNNLIRNINDQNNKLNAIGNNVNIYSDSAYNKNIQKVQNTSGTSNCIDSNIHMNQSKSQSLKTSTYIDHFEAIHNTANTKSTNSNYQLFNINKLDKHIANYDSSFLNNIELQYNKLLTAPAKDSIANQQSKYINKLKKAKLNLHDSFNSKLTGPIYIYTSMSVTSELNIDGNARLSYAVGAGLAGNISDNIYISVGANWGQLNWSDINKYYNKQYTLSEDTSVISVSTTLDSTITYNNKWQYIDVPIQVHYVISATNRSSMDTYLGTSARLFLKEKYETIKEVDGSIIEYSATSYGAFKNYNLVAKLNIGFSYNYLLTDKLKFKLQPQYSMSLHNLSAKNIKNSSLGLNFNICYRFNKNNPSLMPNVNN
jgi:opacity protein-like surface antigen